MKKIINLLWIWLICLVWVQIVIACGGHPEDPVTELLHKSVFEKRKLNKLPVLKRKLPAILNALKKIDAPSKTGSVLQRAYNIIQEENERIQKIEPINGSECYYTDGEDIYVESYAERMYINETYSFEVLYEDPENCLESFAKTNSSLYQGRVTLIEKNIKSFEPIIQPDTQDINFYVVNDVVYFEYDVVPWVDAETLRGVGRNYYVDKYRVYSRYYLDDIADWYKNISEYESMGLSTFDSQTFEVLPYDYVKDENAVYMHYTNGSAQKIHGLDPKTTNVLWDNFLTDTTMMYSRGLPIYITPESHELVKSWTVLSLQNFVDNFMFNEDKRYRKWHRNRIVEKITSLDMYDFVISSTLTQIDRASILAYMYLSEPEDFFAILEETIVPRLLEKFGNYQLEKKLTNEQVSDYLAELIIDLEKIDINAELSLRGYFTKSEYEGWYEECDRDGCERKHGRSNFQKFVFRREQMVPGIRDRIKVQLQDYQTTLK